MRKTKTNHIDTLEIEKDKFGPRYIHIIIDHFQGGLEEFLHPLLKKVYLGNALSFSQEGERMEIRLAPDPFLIRRMVECGYLSKLEGIIHEKELSDLLDKHNPAGRKKRERKIRPKGVLFTQSDYGGLIPYSPLGQTTAPIPHEIGGSENYVSLNLRVPNYRLAQAIGLYLMDSGVGMQIFFDEKMKGPILTLPFDPAIAWRLHEGGFLSDKEARLLALDVTNALQENQRIGRG